MKPLILFLLSIISLSSFAQSTIVSQDFSSSNVVGDYVSGTPNSGQFNVLTNIVNNYPSDEYNNQVDQFPGEATKSITDSKLKFALRSPLAIQRITQGNYFVAYMREATGGFSRSRGSVELAKIQFKFNSNVASGGVDPKTGYIIFNYGLIGTIGENGSTEFSINGTGFTGEHTITILANFSSESKNYSSPSAGSLPALSYDIFVDGNLITDNNSLMSTTNPDMSIEVKSSYAYQVYPGVGPYQGALFEVTFDDILIQDLLGVLPVTLTRFTASPSENNSTLLHWTTTAETNSNYFHVEHSTDAKTWLKIAKVASTGESSKLVNYQYTHTTPTAGKNYYRLKQMDQNNTFAYSRIVSTDFLRISSLPLLYPNPVSDRLFIKDPENTSRVEIFSLSGQTILKSSSNLAGGLPLGDVQNGMYVVKIHDASGTTEVQKIVVQK